MSLICTLILFLCLAVGAVVIAVLMCLAVYLAWKGFQGEQVPPRVVRIMYALDLLGEFDIEGYEHEYKSRSNRH